MKSLNNNALYERIMRNIAKEVKRALNEDTNMSSFDMSVNNFIKLHNITGDWTYDDVMDAVYSSDLTENPRCSEDELGDLCYRYIQAIVHKLGITESVKQKRKLKSLNEKMKYLTDIRFGRESHTAVCDYKDGIDIQYVDIDKMIDYYNKLSKPERLVKSISDRRKLLARWAVAVMMEWHECADVFEAEIRNRRLLTTNSLAGAKASMEQKTTMFKKNWGWYMRVRN